MTFQITIRDEMFGDFTADTEEEAAKAAQEFYANELDTTPDFIEVVNVSPVA